MGLFSTDRREVRVGFVAVLADVQSLISSFFATRTPMSCSKVWALRPKPVSSVAMVLALAPSPNCALPW
jgi:hypothetical protein